MIRPLLLNKLDIVLAGILCLLAVPATAYIYVVFNPRFIPVGIIVFVVSLAYILARRKAGPRLHNAASRPGLYRWLNVAFFGLLAYSVSAYLLRPELYVRPLSFYIVATLMAVVLFIEFVLTRNGHTVFALFKVVLITGLMVWTESLLYTGVVGVDPWYHQWVVNTIMDTGHTPVDISYSGLPGMHSVIIGTSLLTGLGYKYAALVAVATIQMVVNPLFAYLIGRDLYNRKVGLMAALMVGVASWHIMFSYWIIPNGLSIALILPIVYVVFKLSQKRSWWLITIGVLLSAMVTITHPIGSVMLAMVLLAIWLGLWLYGRIGHRIFPDRAFLVSGVVVIVVTLLYWTFVSGSIKYLIGLFQEGFSYEYWGSSVPGVSIPTTVNYVSRLSWGEHLFNYMGIFLCFALSVMGCFVAFSKRLISQRRFAVALVGLVVLVITFIGFVTEGVIIVGRWCYLSQVLLSIPLGMALIWMAGGSIKRTMATSLLVFGLVFMMFMSPQANMDNRTFGPNTIVRSAFTENELGAINEAVELWDGQIAVDEVYYSMCYRFGDKLVDMSPYIASGNYTECEEMLVLVRDEIVDSPIKISKRGPYLLTYDPREALSEQGFIKSFDWGSVTGYSCCTTTGG